MSKQSVLQVDDDGYFAAIFRVELEDEFRVRFCKSAKDALEELSNGIYKVMLLDVMMAPPSEDLRDETDDGLSTGTWMLQQVRDTVIDTPVPVLVLTNRAIEDVQPEIDAIDFPPGLVEVHMKKRISAADLPVMVKRMIDKWHS